jgi:PAS domain S-box-containing protein
VANYYFAREKPDMSTKDPKTPKKWSFSRELLLSMVMLIIFLVGFLSVTHYVYMKNSFESQSDTLRVQSEQNIRGALILTNDAWNILEDTLNERIEQGFDPFMQEYERVDGDPSRMDLVTLKKNLGEGYDLYIINATGVIVESTSPAEMGIDFKKIPYFYDYLSTIRQTSGYYPDRIVRAQLGAGELRKFAYMPTPDHRYVLEIGYTGEILDTINTRLDDQNNIGHIVSVNPYMVRYRIFNTMERQIGTNDLPEESVQGYLREVIATRSDLEVRDNNNDLTTRYLFIDLKNNDSGSDPSRIVELTYDTGLIHDALTALILLHIVIAIIAIIIGCLIAILFSRNLMRPISAIATDVDVIAQGDLSHRVGTTDTREFMALEDGINTMVDSLKTAILTVKDDDIFKENLINQLPVAVFLKEQETGIYTFWNRTSELLFGYTAGEVIGKTDRELFPSGIVDGIEREDREALLKRVEIKYKTITTKTLGARTIHLILVPIYDSHQSVRYILGIAEDFTTETDNLKKDLVFSLTRSDILDQLGIIMTHLERAQLKTTHESMQQFFDKTIHSVESIKNQIAFVRAFQNLGGTAPKWQPVGAAISEAVFMLPDHAVDIQSDIGTLEVFADPLFSRCLFGLMSNSLTSGGPKLATIHISTRLDGDFAILVYEDNGVGIPVDEKEKIFEFAYSRIGGIGLFMIRELLGFTGITIAETGEPGKGARFEIRIPKGRFRNGSVKDTL